MAKLNDYMKYWPVAVFIITLIGGGWYMHEKRIQSCEKIIAAKEEQIKGFEKKMDDFIEEQRAVNTQVIEWIRTQ